MADLPGDSIRIAREYLDSLLVESRIVGAAAPSTKFEFLGEMFETPIMTAALSHIGLVGMARGAKEAGAAVSIGMGGNDELGNVLATGAKVMKIIKPYADHEEIYSRLRFAEENGAMAVGMDVEHAIHADSAEPDCIHGLKMALPTLDELRSFIRFTKLPFFIKGALSVQDAERCASLGCAGIILSHHNGLMRYAVPPVRLLPKIRQAVGRQLLLIADGGMESGYDAFKALALGADAVTVGRPLMGPLKEKGPEGVRDVLLTMTKQLQCMMYRTGTCDLGHMDSSVIWEK
ncbi:MAG: alpha-hydroxy-acid oxidizing protein [Clostridia bacterium]|nr:alpha-hydroxy-acid oxidizing protein [Clostridia bacterium]